MSDPSRAGYVYVLDHVAWKGIGMVKIGKTKRDPRLRAGEITAVSGLIAPCIVIYCLWVNDCTAVETAVHRHLGAYRIRGRELFRVTPEMAIAAINQARCRKQPITVQSASQRKSQRKQPLNRIAVLTFYFALIALLCILLLNFGSMRLAIYSSIHH